MSEKRIAARLLLLLHHMIHEKSLAAKAVLEWIEEQSDLFSASLGTADPIELKWHSLPQLAASLTDDEPVALVVASAESVAAILDLDPFETELLRVGVGIELLPRLTRLRRGLLRGNSDLLTIVGQMAGATEVRAAGAVRRSELLKLGLMEIDDGEIQLSWAFNRILDLGLTDPESLTEALVGPRQFAGLRPEDFVEQKESFELLLRLFAGALAKQARGVNLLLHGPPGTGKTELARSLAAAAGARLFAVGETNDHGDEPNRYSRIHALRRGHRLLARRRDSILLFDEMEDLFSQPAMSSRHGPGSKIFVNRMLEHNVVPTIWTTNCISEIDPAHLRRMSFVLEMAHPSASNRQRIIARIAGEEMGIEDCGGIGQLAKEHPSTASVARVALRTAATAGGTAGDAEAVARSLLVGLNGGRPLPHSQAHGSLDLALYEGEPSIRELVERLRDARDRTDFSLLMTGPPGTGKTALAGQIAIELDRPLLVKRASDLLSKWVGETEANIALAFCEARNEGAVLLFDEVDSLLFNRRDARTSWEVSQVNELLTWMDKHDLPFIAATNHADRLDPATMRRFVFKVALKQLSQATAARAFTHFFEHEPPAGLARVCGLTPGDFAVVRRQLRFRSPCKPDEIVRLLAQEVAARPGTQGRIGF